MRSSTKMFVDSLIEAGNAASCLSLELRSLRALVGKPGQRRSLGGLKKVGTALLLTPTPEPFTDIAGLALIGIGALADRLGPPMTISEMSEEARSLFSSLLDPCVRACL